MSPCTPEPASRTIDPLIVPVSVSNTASPPIVIGAVTIAVSAMSTPLLGASSMHRAPTDKLVQPSVHAVSPLAHDSVSPWQRQLGSASGPPASTSSAAQLPVDRLQVWPAGHC